VIINETCALLLCDGCGYKFDEAGETVMHYTDAGQARDDALDSDWTRTDAGLDLCSECSPPPEQAPAGTFSSVAVNPLRPF